MSDYKHEGSQELPAPVKLHLLSQEGQPYGSERRCCNYCGIALIGPSAASHVDNWTDWRAATNNCQKLERA